MDLSSTVNTNNASGNAEKKRQPCETGNELRLLGGKQRRGAHIGVIITKAKGSGVDMWDLV